MNKGKERANNLKSQNLILKTAHHINGWPRRCQYKRGVLVLSRNQAQTIYWKLVMRPLEFIFMEFCWINLRQLGSTPAENLIMHIHELQVITSLGGAFPIKQNNSEMHRRNWERGEKWSFNNCIEQQYSWSGLPSIVIEKRFLHYPWYLTLGHG